MTKAVMDFIYPRSMDKNELYTTYTAYLELLGRQLDQQLAPGPLLDERIKAIVLLRHCHLDKDQRMHVARRKSGNTAVLSGGQSVENVGSP